MFSVMRLYYKAAFSVQLVSSEGLSMLNVSSRLCKRKNKTNKKKKSSHKHYSSFALIDHRVCLK